MLDFVAMLADWLTTVVELAATSGIADNLATAIAERSASVTHRKVQASNTNQNPKFKHKTNSTK